MGGTQKWMVYQGKSHPMDGLGYPYFRKPPYDHIGNKATVATRKHGFYHMFL